MDNHCVICKKGPITIGQPVENGWLCQTCSAEFQIWKLTSAFKAFKAEKAGNLLTLNLIRDHEYKGGMMCNASLCEACGEEMGRHIIFGWSPARKEVTRSSPYRASLVSTDTARPFGCA